MCENIVEHTIHVLAVSHVGKRKTKVEITRWDHDDGATFSVNSLEHIRRAENRIAPEFSGNALRHNVPKLIDFVK
jgi:hypothetical protein